MDMILKYVELTKLVPGHAGTCPFCGADLSLDKAVLKEATEENF